MPIRSCDLLVVYFLLGSEVWIEVQIIEVGLCITVMKMVYMQHAVHTCRRCPYMWWSCKCLYNIIWNNAYTSVVYHIAGKFGRELKLAVWWSTFATAKLKSTDISYLHIYNTVHMAIPYQAAKFKSTNMYAMAIWSPTTKFNSRQYFRLHGMVK